MFAVALDGPSGAGKSSIAKAAAQRLGFVYVDTGAMYRTIGLYLLEQGLNPEDSAQAEAALPRIEIDLKTTPDGQKMYLCGRDVTELIRAPQVSMAASRCAAHPGVRAFLLELQRGLAQKNNVIMDGRDIGTVVLPNAQLKVFLTATPEERARRRVTQLEESGRSVQYDEVLRDIIERDYRDTHRETAPLRQAEDAVVLDSTELSFDEVVDRLTEMVNERMKGG